MRFAREIRLRRVKCLRTWGIYFISHPSKARIFHNLRRKLFHIGISRYFTRFPTGSTPSTDLSKISFSYRLLRVSYNSCKLLLSFVKIPKSSDFSAYIVLSSFISVYINLITKSCPVREKSREIKILHMYKGNGIRCNVKWKTGRHFGWETEVSAVFHMLNFRTEEDFNQKFFDKNLICEKNCRIGFFYTAVCFLYGDHYRWSLLPC